MVSGDLITKKACENIDGYPLLVGVYTVLRQTKTEDIEMFVNFLVNYARTSTLSKLVKTVVLYATLKLLLYCLTELPITFHKQNVTYICVLLLLFQIKVLGRNKRRCFYCEDFGALL